MKRMASIFAALMTIASIATARSAFGADIATVVSNKMDVTVTSDALAAGEALYVYTQTGTEFNFTLENQSKVWILVVGGGGAGGAGATATTQGTKGSGGGGGAGGFIEQNGISLAPGAYTIAVGAGGAAVGSGNGGDGSPSSIVSSGFQRIAKGGGGGAAAGAGVGNPGGSGGGSSYDAGGDPIAGGAAEDGQGNAGGEGSAAGGGAGGGGAGGSGGSVTSSTSGYGGKGGAGKESAITGATVIYAPGGGGGANTNGQQGLGGLGDNSGKGGARNSSNRATAGTDGIGGGGGGGSIDNSRKSAKGGSGIVIIRVTKIYGEITPPVATDFEYTGGPQTIWPGDEECTVTGDDLTQTPVGTYTFTATPKDGSCWKGTGGSTDPLTITWHIVKASNSLTLVQDGWVEGSPVAPVVSYKVTDNPSEPTLTYSTAEDGEYTTTMPTTPGVYWIKASIAETSNYDGANAGPVQFKILGATESPNANLGFYAPITFPGYIGSGTALIRFTLPPSFQYKTEDNETSSLCVCSANGKVYPQTVEWSDNGAVTITVEIDNMSATKQVFLCWGLVEGGTAPTLDAPSSSTALSLAPTVDNIVRDTSKTLQNYIKDLAMPSWRVGETPSAPEYKYKIGIPTFRYVGTGGYDSSEKPTEPGSYTLMVTIPEETGTANYGPYSGVPATNVTFKIVGETESPMADKSLKYFSVITASSAVSAGKVTINVPSTHDWVATYNDGTDVRFCDIDGNVYPSKLSSVWNGDGSATFAVDVPAMSSGDKFYMCWGETVGKSAPDTAAPSGAPVTATLSVGETVVDTSLTLKNWIRDLKMSSFRRGDSPTVPTCVAKIGTVKYQYSTLPTDGFVDYDTSNPPNPGTYYMRAIVEASDAEGYAKAVSESLVTIKFRVLGEKESPLNALAWFAPVTVTGTLDSPATVAVTLPNTLNYRTINNDGSDIRFSDADGNVLPSAASTAWATNGTAKFNVQVPAFSSSYKFYVCWGPVVGEELPSTTDPTAGAAAPAPTIAVGPAVRDESKWPLVNHWVTAPLFPAAWTISTNTVPYTPGDPAYGTFKLFLRDAADPTGALTGITELPNKAGDFELIACVDAEDYWAGITNDPFEVSVSKRDPSISLTRDHGAEGRVLLMNADVTPGAEIYNQGYADNDPSYSTFWEHSNTVVPPNSIKNNFNVSNEVDSILWSTNKMARLWTLFNCRQGNVFRKDDNYALSNAANYNYLPWDSAKARDIGEHESESHTRHGTGQIIMQNSTEAAVFSSCFTNGIGTVYFDAVNHRVTNATFKAENFTLKVFIATDCITSLGDVIDVVPTDEYIHEFDETEPEAGVIVTNANWRAVEAVAIRIENGVMGAATTNETITLDVANGKADNNFYRVLVRLDITVPVRFKIVRMSRNEAEKTEALDNYILLDNIIASYPAMRASITTYGDYDAEKKGKQVIGQQAALGEVFPSIDSDNLFARGKVSFYTNAGLSPEDTKTNDFITSARFNYRWRHLNHRFYRNGEFSSVDDGKFSSVRLSKVDDYKISTRPLDLPGLPGDIEYWYELVLGAPYYEYHDYSGLNAGVGDYTEEITYHVARADASFINLPSAGTNWFVRVREGASRFERMDLIITEALPNSDITKTEPIAMDLVGDHQWRGFVVVTNKTERNLTFYIKGVNPQVDGETEYDASGANDVEYRAREETVDIASSPFAGVMAAIGEEVGYRAKLHYLTNVASYVEFQFNDETRAISISHADYQDFNTWFSSRCEDVNALMFYSSAHETNSTTVATKRYPAEATNKVVATFAETPRTATAWHEEFALTEGQSPVGFPKNEPFQSMRTPKGWLADQGMWVAQEWGMTNSIDFALQMEGRGKGSVTFNQSPTPNGLDTIEFSTRLAQFTEFDDISFSWDQIMRKNYTIAAQACFDTDPQFANFSGEGSVSLFTGYVPNRGCYEYRITIYNLDAISTDDGKTIASVSHAIYKWAAKDGKLVAEPLVEVNYANSDGWYWTKGPVNPDRSSLVKNIPLGRNGDSYSGIFMSISNDNNKVVITAGVSKNAADKLPAKADFRYDKQFMQIGCVDTSPVTTFGTYGVAIKNCPGQILYPRIYEDATVAIQAAGTTPIDSGCRWEGPVGLLNKENTEAKVWYVKEVTSSLDKLKTCWGLRPGRIKELRTDTVWGLVADTDIAQEVGVYTMPVGSADNWTCLTNISVDTFNNDAHVLTLQSTRPSYVKFASSGKPDDIRTDIVIDNITLTQWCGQSGSSTNASSSYGYADDFYYTGAWISNQVTMVSGKATTNRIALLAPRRAESPESPLGIRSPYMNGLGAIVFNYRDADEDAELELQEWVGSISYLYGHLNDAADEADWTTLTNWTFSAGESGTKSYYFGLRSPSNGVFRIVVPQQTVRNASAHKDNPNWAAIAITDIYCYDEPAFDSHSWWGWNFLTTGWSDGKGNKYAAIDDHDAGAVGVLNNTLAPDSLETGNPNDYERNDPFIQSPTFNDRNVGEIAFRARRYADSSPSYITVWGAKSGDLQKTDGWTAITNVLVDAVSYKRYTVKCADEQGFAAVRLGVAKVPGIMPDYAMTNAPAAKLPDGPPVRVLVDEIVIRERVKPEVGFRVDFVRPFRLGLSERTAVENIASRDQQPLLGEQFGFQAEVEVTGLSDEVDLGHTPEVRLSLYPKAEPWGYDNWKEAEGAVLDILLEPAEGTNLVFRSMSTTPLSFTGPFEADPDLGYGIVQYFLTVKYWDKGGDYHVTRISETQWKMPSWYHGFDDPNEINAKFSPFTVLDTVSPGRAWFNEVNFSDVNGNNSQQFIELCFPAGYDMTGWRIYRYDVWGTLDLLANLGRTTGVPASKDATGGDPNFAFLALTSSKAAHPDADANWSSDAYVCGGTDTYGFQLVRPSGIIEQQVVVQGKIGSGRYSNNKLGTNVVVQLNNLVGGTWEFVSADTNVAEKSSGVFQNAGSLPSDWNDTMDMSPGMINGGQTIPSDWFLPPSGTNVWLTLSTLGSYVWVVDGADRVAAKTIVIPQGTTTNLVFETAPWYQLGTLMRDVTNDVTAAAVRSAGVARTNVWTYAFREDARNSATLVASAAPDREVLIRGGLDPNDPYTPAVMNWLLEGTANGDPFEHDEISTNCFFWGLSAGSVPVPLSLKDRYWLDIDPTSDDWDLRGGMGEISNLTAPTPTVPVVAEVRRRRPAIWPDPLTNRVVSVALMISNKQNNALSRAPNRLQGLGGEKSDVVGARNWTSETFKVMMSLIKPTGSTGIDVSDNYWPMATFVFDANSFGAPDGPNPFTARIEMSDPTTKASPAYAYGWWKYPNSTYGYKWDLSHGTYMRAPDMLSTTNTWDKTWDTPNDW